MNTILTRNDLKLYLSLDSQGYTNQVRSWKDKLRYNLLAHPAMDNGAIWEYIKTLRHLEFFSNQKPLSLYSKMGIVYYSWKLRKLGYKTGFQIPPNVVGPGLTIFHYGSIIVNDKCKIGKNAVLNPNITIGHKVPGGPAPVIGDNVFIGSGARVIGGCHIGNNVTIAPNAVVTKDVEDNVVIGGIPAKIIRRKE